MADEEERYLGVSDVDESYETIDALDPKDKIIEELTSENEIKARKIKTLRVAVLAIAFVLGFVVIAIVVATSFIFKYIASISLSGDKATVRDFNAALAADENIHGKPEDENAALQVLSDSGFQIDQWNPSTVYYKAYWYAGANRFLLYNSQTNKIEYPSEYEGLLSHLPGGYTLYLLENGKLTFVISRDGNYVYLGTYPQAEVTDSATVSALNTAAGTLPTESNSQAWTSYGYYDDGKADTDYMWYIDLTRSGERYRGVYFTSYRPNNTASSASSSNQDDNGYNTSTVYWFRYEPIKWRILSEAYGEARIFAEMALDSQEYCHYTTTYSFPHNGDRGYSNNYALSDIRAWLNDTFYNTAFNDQQKELILCTTVDNSARSTSDSGNGITQAKEYACANTEDYVFLLSMQDATTSTYGFDSDYTSYDTARRKQNTDYAKCQGAWTSTDDDKGNGFWWLRSPTYGNRSSASCIYHGGYAYGNHEVTVVCSVVPALRIRLAALTDSEKTNDPTGDNSEPNIGGDDENVPSDFALSRDGDYVYFGTYPQSEVTDSTTLSALNTAAGTLPTESNSQAWTSYGYYVDGKADTDYMWYIDLPYEGERYRGVYFTQYRPSSTAALSYDFNSNQDENGYTAYTVYWFRYEPIKWRILDEADGEALVLAEMVLDGQEYCHYTTSGTFSHNGGMGYANNYALSNIRAWLNDTFYNTAFTSLQKELILLTTVDNSARSTSDWGNGITQATGYACADTEDYVFLLSEQEVTNTAYGFDSNYNVYDTARRKQNTDYARCQGASTSTDDDKGNGLWWLRSPYYDNGYYSRYASDSGSGAGRSMVSYTDNGAVPALRIRLS